MGKICLDTDIEYFSDYKKDGLKLFTIYAYIFFLLSGTLFFIPDWFVSRFITAPAIWWQVGTGIGFLGLAGIKRKNINLPPIKYLILILLWVLYRLFRSKWNIESSTSLLTEVITFFIFYWFWKSSSHKQIVFLIFISLGIILAGWGIGQYIGWIPRINNSFAVTGPFDNPAGISVSLAVLFPFSLYSCIYLSLKYRVFSILTSCILLIVIILSQARAAVFASIVILIVCFIRWLKTYKNIRLSGIHYLLSSIICLFILIGLFFVKKDSATGRLLIWYNSTQLLKKKPSLGLGENGFTANYMTEQARYFAKHTDNKSVMLADNVRHPFNEFLKELVNFGIIGFVLIAFLIVFPLYHTRKNNTSEMFSVQLSLMAAGICAIFSYPLDYPFIRFVVIILLSFVSASMENKNTIGVNTIYINLMLAICSLFILTSTVYQYYCQRKWMIIAHKSLAGQTAGMLSEYNKLYRNTYLGENGLFLYNYGAELNYIGKYGDSNEILLSCMKYMNDYDVQMLLGDNYEQLKHFRNAEKHYKLAHQMIPSKFMPLYILVKLFGKTNQKEQEYQLALEIVGKEIKIPSLQITQIKNEMNEIIQHQPIKN